MTEKKWNMKFGISLIIISIVLYVIHVAIFKDFHHIAVFFLEDLAFIPIDVLVVTFIFEKVLSDREKKHTMEKLNMLIGVFFSEAGGDLLKLFVSGDSNKDATLEHIQGIESWENPKFDQVAKKIRCSNLTIDMKKIDRKKIADYLERKRSFLIGMLQNPSLLEHDTFTELLQAVFHLELELENYKDQETLTEEDLEHIKGDFERVYPLLLFEWIINMKYMKSDYPYAYAMTIRNIDFR